MGIQKRTEEALVRTGTASSEGHKDTSECHIVSIDLYSASSRVTIQRRCSEEAASLLFIQAPSKVNFVFTGSLFSQRISGL